MNKEKEINLTGFEIAIIGMDGRFPGAADIDEFWENLKNGIESISFLSDQELLEAGEDPGLVKNPNYVKASGFLPDIDYFDSSFFNYSPVEALLMDPQVRIFHECAWKALEDAGYCSETYSGLIGLYAGAPSNFNWNVRAALSGEWEELGTFAAEQLVDKDFLCAWVSYKLDLKGPVFSLYTACSTSLVAIHTACQAILNGECDMALAGGISATSIIKSGYLYQEGMLLSPHGHIRAFDAGPHGVVGGSGAALVVLKRLEEATADRDHIYAVIKGSAVNNDGVQKLGFSAPSVEGQARVIKAALFMAELKPESISYIETHGTGTELGDTIEIEALKLVFKTDKKKYCGIGSVKTNVGHLDTAAGATGLIKTALALKHRLLPPSLNFKRPNPKIDFENSPFYVNTTLKNWEGNRYPLRAGVSSFAIGGTNAHVILEEFSEIENRDKVSPPSRNSQLILLSANTETALDKISKNLARYLKKNPGINPGDLAYSLQIGRKAFKYRSMFVCSTVNEAVEILSSQDPLKVPRFLCKDNNRIVIFMFAGLGSQYVNMGRELYEKEPVFRSEMNRCFEILKSIMGCDIKEILYPGEARGPAPSSEPPASVSVQSGNHSSPDRINRTEINQLLIFIFEYALAKLLMKWEIKPGAMIGYSFGEYAAACIAGVFSLEDALRLIVLRGKLLKKVPTGAMLSVPLTKKEIKPLIDNDLSIAIDNGSSCVVAGTNENIEVFEKLMNKKKYVCMRLQASYAIHSHMMEPISGEFKEIVNRVILNKPQIPYISNVTGKWITAEEAANPAYWAKHLKQTVQFADGLKELKNQQNAVFIEIGPGRDLSALIMRYLENNPDHKVINTVRHPQENIPDISFLLNKIGLLWLWGGNIDLNQFYPGEKRQRIPLPTYPFERDRYFFDKDPFKAAARDKSSRQLLKNPNISDWFYILSWQRSLTPFIDVDEQIKAKAVCWLVFAHSSRLCSLLIERLKEAAHHIIVVNTGPVFKQVKDTEFMISPQDWTHYDSLFNTLVKLKKVPDKILHSWGMQENKIHAGASEAKINETVKALDIGFFSLMNIARACEKQGITGSVEIFILGRGLQGVTGEETVSAAKAAALGLVWVIPQEIPNIKCTGIDLSHSPSSGPGAHKLVKRLLAEFYAKSTDLIISYRKSQRWVRTFTPVKLEETLESRAHLRERGVYVITGGLGNVAMVLALHLAVTVKARLVLLGRSPFPTREQWEDRLTNNKGQDPVNLKIQRIREMEAAGARVLVLQADVSHRQQMHRAILRAEKEFGKINGVIHAAGIIGDRTFKLINGITREACEEQFQAKIYGLLVLEEVLAHKDLDFCLLTSSLASVLGGLGFAAYSASNIFMDAFVQQYNKTSPVPWISVNWDGWYFQKGRDNPGELKPGDLAMTEEEACAAFQRILGCGEVEQVVVSLADLDARIAKWVKLESLHENQKENQESQVKALGKRYARPHLSSPYQAPEGELEQKVVEAWQQFFKIEPVGTKDDFFELGGDSLKAVQLASQIKKLDIDITIEHLFSHHNIREICKHLQPQSTSGEKDLEALEGYLSGIYNTEVNYREYRVGVESYRILFLAHEPPAPGEVLENIEKKANPRIITYPHYIIFIKPGEAVPAPGEMDEKVLADLAGLKDRINETNQDRLLKELNQNNHLTALLKKNTPVREYGVSPPHKGYLLDPLKSIETNFIYYSYDFSYPLDIGKITCIVSTAADRNSLLRSVIVEDKEQQYFIKEYDTFSNLRFPFLDLSGYTSSCREAFISKAALHLKKPLDVVDNVLYRAALLKLDHSHYRFLAQFNHLIFDAGSIANLDKQFQELSQGLEPRAQTVPKLDYHDYVDFLKRQNYDHIELEKYLNLHDYSSSIEKIEKHYHVGVLEYENLELDISIIDETYKEHYNQVVLLTFASVIIELFEVDKAPIRYYSYGRIYKDGDFSSIIGDFPDDVPVLFSMEDFKTPHEMVDYFIRYRRFISENNLNFLNYVDKGHLAGVNYTRLLSPFIFNSVIGSYEYFKKIGIEEAKRLSKLEKPTIPYFYMGVVEDFHANKLWLLFLHNSGFKIKEVFMKKYFELVEGLNRKKV